MTVVVWLLATVAGWRLWRAVAYDDITATPRMMLPDRIAGWLECSACGGFWLVGLVQVWFGWGPWWQKAMLWFAAGGLTLVFEAVYDRLGSHPDEG